MSSSTLFLRLLPLLLTASIATTASAQLRFERAGVAVRENFRRFTGAGFSPTPAAGQLDSNAFRVSGASDPGFAYGELADTGDYARGVSTGGVSTGGVYAFLAGGPSNAALGLQPTSSDFTRGSVRLRFRNDTGSAIDGVDVAFTLYTLNDEARSIRVELQHTLDEVTFTDTPIAFETAGPADPSPRWVARPQRITLRGFTIAPGGLWYLNFQTLDGPDVPMEARDEVAIDDIAVTALRAGTTCDTAADCDDGNACTINTCIAGLCGYENRPRGFLCQDESVCNGEETCDGAGSCGAGAPLDCDDGMPCTADSCDPSLGCSSARIESCCLADADCDDGDPCTTDICAIGNMCRNEPSAACGADGGAPDGGPPGEDAGSDAGSGVGDGGSPASDGGGVPGGRRGGGCSAADHRDTPATAYALLLGLLAVLVRRRR